MKLRCPKCQEPCGWFGRQCPNCGFDITVQSLCREGAQSLRKFTAIQCACCRRGFLPLGTKVCPVCGAVPTIQDTVRAVCAPTFYRVENYLKNIPPRTKRVVQWLYLLLSATVLWVSLDEVQRLIGGRWGFVAALSVVHLAAIGFLAVWLLPRRLVFAISRYAPGKVKLALVFNFLTSVLLLQVAIHEWPQRAFTLAGLYFVLWAAARLLNRYVLPEAWLVRWAFMGPSDEIDSSTAQSRSARFD